MQMAAASRRAAHARRLRSALRAWVAWGCAAPLGSAAPLAASLASHAARRALVRSLSLWLRSVAPRPSIATHVLVPRRARCVRALRRWQQAGPAHAARWAASPSLAVGATQLGASRLVVYALSRWWLAGRLSIRLHSLNAAAVAAASTRCRRACLRAWQAVFRVLQREAFRVAAGRRVCAASAVQRWRRGAEHAAARGCVGAAMRAASDTARRIMARTDGFDRWRRAARRSRAAGVALARTTPLLMSELVYRWRHGGTAYRRADALRVSLALVSRHAATARAVRQWGAAARRMGVHTAAAAGGDCLRLRVAWAAWRWGHAQALVLHAAPAVAADALRLCRALSRWGRARAARRIRAAIALLYGRALVRQVRRAFAHFARAANRLALAKGWVAARLGCARAKACAASRLRRAMVRAAGPGAAGALLRWRGRTRAHGSVKALHSQLGRVVAHATRGAAALRAWRRAAAPVFRARRVLLTRAWQRLTAALPPRCPALRHRPARLLVHARRARSLAAGLTRLQGHRARVTRLELACAVTSRPRYLQARRDAFDRWRRRLASAHQGARGCRWRQLRAAMARWRAGGARCRPQIIARLTFRRRALGARVLQWRGSTMERSVRLAVRAAAARAAAARQRARLRLALRHWWGAHASRRWRLALFAAAADFRARRTRGGAEQPRSTLLPATSSCWCATEMSGCECTGWVQDENIWVQPWVVRGV